MNSLQNYRFEDREQLIVQKLRRASVMSSRHCGVSARKQSLAKHAFHMHCNAHCLNLVIVPRLKAVPEASCFFFFITAPIYISIWTLCTPEKAGHTVCNVAELPKFSDVRWACRLNPVKTLSTEFQLFCVPPRCVEAQGLCGQKDLNFIGLLSFRRLLGDTKFLSELLQFSSLNLVSAWPHWETTGYICVLHRWSSLGVLWTEVLDIDQQCNISTERVSKMQPNTNSALHGSVVTSTIDQENSDQDSHCTTVFYPILDTVHAELESCVSKPIMITGKGFKHSIPKATAFWRRLLCFCWEPFTTQTWMILSMSYIKPSRSWKGKQLKWRIKPVCLSSRCSWSIEVFSELFRLWINCHGPTSKHSCLWVQLFCIETDKPWTMKEWVTSGS